MKAKQTASEKGFFHQEQKTYTH